MNRSNNGRMLWQLACAVGLWAIVGTAAAQAPRALPEGKLPDDKRLGSLVDLNGYFPFSPPATKEAWLDRAEAVRRQLRVATGLWPMPERTTPQAVIHGRVDREEYTVDKVFLQSVPGHFVTGSLYRPKGREGRLPAVLCPHGHWPNGRFHDHGEKKVLEEIVVGAERFEVGGRHPVQARCVQLARMGCVVFQYDMIGYADSVQLAHRAGARAVMDATQNWGYFSPQAELRLESLMGLQTYNSIRVLDWFSELPDVDPQRIAVTGCSGGGTQTFILCALDPRPIAAFPAVMVSTAMQGGCTCENACYLRRGTGNIELAALIAPRPLGMTAADDWTKEIATKGLPELKQVYKLMGVEKLVTAKPLLHFPHNYNYVSREVMYHWMNKYLKLGLSEPIIEHDYRPLSAAELTVWDDSHPKPPSGDDYERSLVRTITAVSDRQMQALIPKDSAALAKFREVVGGAVDVLIGRRLPPAGAVAEKPSAAKPNANQGGRTALLRYATTGEEVPVVILVPQKVKSRAESGTGATGCSAASAAGSTGGQATRGTQGSPAIPRCDQARSPHVVLWISKEGKSSLFGAGEKPMPRKSVQRLLDNGVTVMGVDLFGQGEFTSDGKPMAKNRLNRSGRDAWSTYAGYTYGYNDSLFAQRVHDILSAVSYSRHGLKAERVSVVGLDGAGHWVAAARAQAGGAIDRAVIDTAGFRFAALTAIDDADFLPGAAKYLDLPGMLALSAPHPLWLAGESASALPVVTAAYQAAGATKDLATFQGPKDRETAAVEWLLHGGTAEK